ncbi:exopolyphosphatase [Acidihalobacter yilgarnensis]|uniref:Exopolyphosphatase n=1 Tax=Acidihalobacter yilgarnensis TaxID=2819280 RepID=A0A1D8ILD1_9GAMM|nr:exopolyphosphatase [Acidihalobacter yilgarnensis]AOU97235.1 exopolyphosphatase [Acidihalobacter yilgarnensis]
MWVKRRVPESVAAIDLGSNSFHMVVASVLPGGELRVVDRLKEMVRLAGGLDESNQLTAEAQNRAIECLQRFGERIRGFPRGSVRAVGTNTLRQARNSAVFLDRVAEALGHPVEVIAGREEARLVYLGVAHSLAAGNEQRLVVDIGGGSTELIIGQGYETLITESVYMGCVSTSAEWFADGQITAPNWSRAVLAARLELEPLVESYRQMGWGHAIGASGTIITTERVISEAGLGAYITLAALHALRDRFIEAGEIGKLKLSGVSRERLPVFPGGVAVLQGVFEALGIERMEAATGALREGVLNDLVGRIRHEDVRLRTVQGFSKRYHVDADHAARIARTAAELLTQVSEAWQLDEEDADHLNWAAQLHEIGLDVAHSEYHKHGAYLLEHADLPGFSRQDQMVLAVLVRTHRRKFAPRLFECLPAELRGRVMRLSTLLRLAVVLHRSRVPDGLPETLSLQVDGDVLSLRLDSAWRETHPLIEADIENERQFLRGAKFKLAVT